MVQKMLKKSIYVKTSINKEYSIGDKEEEKYKFK